MAVTLLEFGCSELLAEVVRLVPLGNLGASCLLKSQFANLVHADGDSCFLLEALALLALALVVEHCALRLEQLGSEVLDVLVAAVVDSANVLVTIGEFLAKDLDFAPQADPLLVACS